MKPYLMIIQKNEGQLCGNAVSSILHEQILDYEVPNQYVKAIGQFGWFLCTERKKSYSVIPSKERIRHQDN